MLFVMTKNVVKTKHNGNTIETKVEVPQFESIQEVVNAAGGDDKALAWINKRVEQAAIAGPRNYGATASEGTSTEDIISKMCDLSKSWTFGSTRRGEGVKAKAEKFDKVKALIAAGNYSQDDLLSILEEIK